jgi:hypothetical protein
MTPECLLQLAAAAVAAPTADNHHVFRLEPMEGGLSLRALPEYAQSTPGRRILAQISAGAMVENLLLRAARLGIRLQAMAPDVRAERFRLDLIAHDAAPVQQPLEAAIEHRHTNRRFRYHGPPLPAAAQRQLSAHGEGLGGAALVWLDEPGARRQAVKLVRWAETERFRNPMLHAEMFGSVRFDAGWTESTSEGVPLGSLELPRLERPMFALMRNWPLQRLINAGGMHHFIGWRGAALPCRLAPHLCVITGPDDSPASAVNAGRLLQRVWLGAHNLGLAFQMFAASAVYAIKGAYPVPKDLRRRLESGWATLCPEARPYLAFRMGYAEPVTVRAGRPLPHSLLA